MCELRESLHHYDSSLGGTKKQISDLADRGPFNKSDTFKTNFL